ncbi:uncharacterized protein Tpt [Eurosta solidaginis]|uniref:uncharacterized protein Tpt n=1 Tax=Eurosta solidaginis TaxID=178769 RepID=UPI003530952D
MDIDVQLSKRLSWLLRHGAILEGFQIGPDGYVEVDAILHHPRYARDFNLENLKHIVDKDKKQRYSLRLNSRGLYEIRANQGHSIDEVKASHALERIYKADDVKFAVHGTYYKYWPQIKREGLRPMGRLHIHFAIYDEDGKKGDKNSCISGIRSNVNILIYLHVRKAMECGGMQIYRSSNNVMLSSGIDGCIPKEYFLKVIDRRTGQELPF